jgi:hypothetical protein
MTPFLGAIASLFMRTNLLGFFLIAMNGLKKKDRLNTETAS